jgi:Holliday junction resolvase RusA-like endonuclease
MYKTVMQKVPGKRGKVPVKKLQPEGKVFKKHFTSEVVPRYQRDMMFLAEALEDPNVVLVGVAEVRFESLVNSTWPGKAKSRFKKLDADNRGKIVFDGFAKAFATVDDSRFFYTGAMKVQDPEEGVLLHLTLDFCDSFGVPLWKPSWEL